MPPLASAMVTSSEAATVHCLCVRMKLASFRAVVSVSNTVMTWPSLRASVTASPG
jgi:hypothetical protein